MPEEGHSWNQSEEAEEHWSSDHALRRYLSSSLLQPPLARLANMGSFTVSTRTAQLPGLLDGVLDLDRKSVV